MTSPLSGAAEGVTFEQFRLSLTDPRARAQINLLVSDDDARKLASRVDWAQAYYDQWSAHQAKVAPRAAAVVQPASAPPAPVIAQRAEAPRAPSTPRAPVIVQREEALPAAQPKKRKRKSLRYIGVGAAAVALAGAAVFALNMGPAPTSDSHTESQRAVYVDRARELIGLGSVANSLAAGTSEKDVEATNKKLINSALVACNYDLSDAKVRSAISDPLVEDQNLSRPRADAVVALMMEYCETK